MISTPLLDPQSLVLHALCVAHKGSRRNCPSEWRHDPGLSLDTLPYAVPLEADSGESDCSMLAVFFRCKRSLPRILLNFSNACDKISFRRAVRIRLPGVQDQIWSVDLAIELCHETGKIFRLDGFVDILRMGVLFRTFRVDPHPAVENRITKCAPPVPCPRPDEESQ